MLLASCTVMEFVTFFVFSLAFVLLEFNVEFYAESATFSQLPFAKTKLPTCVMRLKRFTVHINKEQYISIDR